MTTEDSTLREVDQGLAEERQYQVMRQFGPILAGIAVAVVMAVGGYQFYTSQKEAKATTGALSYQDAIFSLEEDPVQGREQLADLMENPASGYAALAAFQRASLLAQAGDTTQAYLAYKHVASLEGITPQLQALAKVHAAYLSLDAGGREAVKADLGELPLEETPLGYYAREVQALAALADEDFDAAIEGFEFLTNKNGVPAALQRRAAEFAVVAKAGKGGANISGKARVDDLLDRLGESATPSTPGQEQSPQPPEAGSPEGAVPEAGHEGHDHGGNEGHDDGHEDDAAGAILNDLTRQVGDAVMTDAVKIGTATDTVKEGAKDGVEAVKETVEGATDKVVEDVVEEQPAPETP